jgi:acetolactate synthase-1/2/3 large subunit
MEEAEQSGEGVTVPYLMACLRTHIDERAIVLNEGITNYHLVHDHLAPVRPGAILASGGGSLGWNGGAAIGAKLARPEATVVAVTGDGSYLFAQPSTVHWIARRYAAPFLHVVLNNKGWAAPRQSALSVHPDGYASRDPDIGLSFEPSPDYAGIAAAAGNALALRIDRRDEVQGVLAQAFATLARERRSVVIDAQLS